MGHYNNYSHAIKPRVAHEGTLLKYSNPLHNNIDRNGNQNSANFQAKLCDANLTRYELFPDDFNSDTVIRFDITTLF